MDPGFCVRAADALVDGLGTAGVARLVVVGLGANLLGADGRMVLDGPVAFPAALRRFAPARTAGLDRLRKRGDGHVDRVVLTPAGFLEQNGPRTGRYHAERGADASWCGREQGDGDGDGEPWLSYADLAVAVADESEAPVRQRARVSVFNVRTGMR
ncbi:NAD-binding protein [Streptomyces lasalocidi]